jgi:hypothetical protein
MRPSIGVASVAALLILLAACTSNAASQPEPSPNQSKQPTTSPSTSPTPVAAAAFATESARTIRKCGVKREFDTAGVPNPCEQAAHLHALFLRNKEWESAQGFTIHVGGIGKCGIRLTVDGDVAAARETLGSDPLIARITGTDGEGFPPDC